MPEITLDELSRLIRILGMLGSAHDGEALNAARLACRWVLEHDTSWWALLTPEPEPAVSGVAVAGVDPGLLDALEEAHAADRAQAYRNGFQAGLEAMKQQLKAQAAALQATHASYGNAWMGPATGPGVGQGGGNPQGRSGQGLPPGGPQGLSGGASVWPGAGQGQTTQAAQRAPRAAGNPYPAGSWQWVAQELLDRHAAVPGVLRSREEAFVGDVLRRGFASLTTAQEAWLRDIAGRSGLAW